ncbi:Scr1 family TA system antitoxin-like transcriptional regulator [Kitasatospora aureofaciens]|uniref:Scr1 family TA system antitoxin-like transcriptional regulator n=1 Tax=Kitasatospora aureofaciens TaxID=1894 RepID=UPI0033A94C7E
MSTDFQQARIALGQRLRELRAEGGLTGRQLADRLGWTQSKVSKLETGRQTATHDDLKTWADGVGQSDAAAELSARLRAFESGTRSWRRQLAAGHKPVQDAIAAEHERSTVKRAWQNSVIVGVLQTADYARHIFNAYVGLHQSPRDVDDAVRARIRRQEILYRPGKRYHIIMWEAALRAQLCPPAVSQTTRCRSGPARSPRTDRPRAVPPVGAGLLGVRGTAVRGTAMRVGPDGWPGQAGSSGPQPTGSIEILPVPAPA